MRFSSSWNSLDVNVKRVRFSKRRIPNSKSDWLIGVFSSCFIREMS